MRIHHIALRTKNIEKLTAFYGEVLGVPVRERRPNGSVWLAAGEVILMLEAAAPGEPDIAKDSMEFLSFRIKPDERDGFARKLADTGIHVEAESDFTIYFRDTDGRRVGVSHFPEPRDKP